jgi:rfaE bifunctional protein kinase chain/domain
MNAARFREVTGTYRKLRVAVVGDFCLDRYLEIDPARQEVSIETGLPVHNVVNVRSQPGGAGTILNNLAALGMGAIYPVGFAGTDGEGYELERALSARPHVRLDHFFQTPHRRTFTYTKPLVMEPGQPPRELNRLDLKNWTATPGAVEAKLIKSIRRLASEVEVMILLSQVDVAETGVVTVKLLEAIRALGDRDATLLVLADSRRGLRGYASVGLKMNLAELAALTGTPPGADLKAIAATAAALAGRQAHYVFITMAEQGILGAAPDGKVAQVPALPVRGPIDIVGAGDAVTANLAAALAAGATVREAIELANAAASVVIHQLGTTGTASVRQIRELIGGS